MRSLSVVVIARNEEAHIARCLDSILVAVAEVGQAEVVVVDSVSTDRTVEIARSFCVRVISLRPEWPLSPSAGRYVGFHHTTGELIMFVDGDTVIEPDWFRNAIPWFDQPQIAGVSGFFDDRDKHGRLLPYVGKRSQEICEINSLRGSALYRRAAMEQAGTFNPYLSNEEEAEVALRLRRAGWKLVSLPHPMACHQRAITGMEEIRRAIHLGRFYGGGVTWRYAAREGLGFRFCFERLGSSMMFALMCLLLSPGLFLWLMGYTRVAGPFLIALIAWIATVAIKKRSLTGPLNYSAYHTLILAGLIVGAIRARLEDPRAYPLDVIEVSVEVL
jgi:glycosyltransferase involved in cell wall biosynthesis